MSKDQLIEMIMNYFGMLNNALGVSLNMLLDDPGTTYPTMTAVVDSIFSVLLGISYVLIVMFFIIDLTAKSVMLEVQNYEIMAKLLLRLLIAKVIVENCRGLMYAIFYAFQDIISVVSGGGAAPLGDEAQAAILNHVETMDGGIFGIYYLTYFISMMPTLLIVWVVGLFASVIVIGRLFEIMIYSAVAPLPLSTLAGETSTDTAKGFIKSYIAVCLQGLLIVITFRLFGGMIGDAYTGNADIGVFLVLVIVFALTLFKSGTWSKQIVGAM